MIQHLDAITWLENMPTQSVDLVVTDPAYESLEKHRARGTTTRLDNWFPIFKNEKFPLLFAHLFRVLRNDSHCYVLCDAETMFVVKPIAEAAGFKFWKPIVWDKMTIGMGYHYRARSEFVLFFEKGQRRLRSLSVADVLPFPRVRGGYPTQKPVELLSVLIEQSSDAGDIVIDPFAGSGSTGVAATKLGRIFAGCDVNENCGEIYRRRIVAEIEDTGEESNG